MFPGLSQVPEGAGELDTAVGALFKGRFVNRCHGRIVVTGQPKPAKHRRVQTLAGGRGRRYHQSPSLVGASPSGGLRTVLSGPWEFCSAVPTSVLQRVAAGDPAAVRECLDRFGALVWSLARRLTPTEAEDAVQDVFVALWKSAGRFDPAVASETTFVAMVARRRLIERARARGRQTIPEALTDSAASVERLPKVELGEEAALAASVIETLSAEQQRVLRLSIYQGLSHEQVSQSTGLPLGTVKTHIRRGLMRVRDALETERGIVK